MTIDSDKQINQLASDWLNSNLENKTLVLACGGSAAKIFANAWKSLSLQKQNLLTITLTDERYGKVGHPQSNWKQLQTLGVDLAPARHVPVLRAGLSIEETATEWGKLISKKLNENEKVLAIFGIGEDSHIAGLKPSSPLLHETTKIIGAYTADDFERVSITPVFFPKIHNAIIFASGEAKRSAIDLLNQDLDASHYPDQLIKQTGQYTVYYQP